jgi:lysozyme
MGYTPGIDVSLYQKDVNWAEVYAAGARFAFIKCSQGVTVTDPKFATNWTNAKAAGMLVGVYHFINPTLAAADQLTHLLQVLGDRTPDLPIALDVEKPVDSDPPDVTQVVTDFVTLLTQRTGRKPLLYTGPSYWNAHVHGGLNWAEYDLWIANYGVTTPMLPKAWTTWRFWQYSGSGQIDGVSTPVDRNWFNGSEDDLKAYAQHGTTPAAQTVAPANVQAAPITQVMYIITRDGLRVHDNPAISATVIKSLPYKTKLIVEAQVSGIFVKISSPLVGWIAKGEGNEDYIGSDLPQA